jgi:peptidoglycan-associated lipoprotein
MRVALLGAVLFLAGCGAKRIAAPAPIPAPAPAVQASLFVLLPEPDGRASAVSVTNNGGSQELVVPNMMVQVVDVATRPSPPEPIDPARIRQLFGPALDALPPVELAFNLYFQLGTTALSPESEAILAGLLQAVRDRRATLLTVTGHTDSTGTSRDANYRLGLERATMVAQRLGALGLDPDSFVIRSHGQDDLLVPTPPNTNEPRNRRVEVIVW